MKVLLLHGVGIEALFKKLDQLKSEFQNLEIRQLIGKETNLKNLQVEVSSGLLFSDQRLIIIESPDPTWDISEFKADEGVCLVFYAVKTIQERSNLVSSIKRLNGQILNFGERDEISIFPFLDLLVEQNPKVLEEFKKFYDQYGGQYILTMIYYQLRKLISPGKNLPPFVLKKIHKQRELFTEVKIKQLYKECLEYDFKLKSGLIDERLGMELLLQKFLTI